LSNYKTMSAGQKAAFTRKARQNARANYPIGYQVAVLMANGADTASSIVSTLGLTDYQARGYMTRVRRGDFDDCRL